jgi:hypothetical protein
MNVISTIRNAFTSALAFERTFSAMLSPPLAIFIDNQYIIGNTVCQEIFIVLRYIEMAGENSFFDGWIARSRLRFEGIVRP